MKKFAFAVMVAAVLATAPQAFAGSFDLYSSFDGQVGGAVAYVPMGNVNNRWIVGGGASFPTNTGTAGYYALLGMENAVPLLGGIDVELIALGTSASNVDGLFAGATGTSYDINLIKKWMFPLTDTLKIGFKISLLSFEWNTMGTPVSVTLGEMTWPIIGATVQF